jgi:hypothetical protein
MPRRLSDPIETWRIWAAQERDARTRAGSATLHILLRLS